MLKKLIHAVFLYDNKRKVMTILLVLAFIGCIKNDERLFSQETITVESTNTGKKIAFLTFDDGPSNMTEEVLDILKDEGVTATFFMIGSQITDETEPLLIRMEEEGHLIGMHTYTHKYKEIYASADAYIEDVEKTAQRIYEVTGNEPSYYRFPWGSSNGYISTFSSEIISQMQENGYTYFDWNVSGDDSVGKPSKQKILKNVQKDYKKYNEPVILLHDSSINQNTAEILGEIIEELKAQGYSFATIDKRSNPCQFSNR